MSAGSAPAASNAAGLEQAEAKSPESRNPLSHLLHALNQPLTGLQCSLELALARPLTPEQYTRTLREGLELTGRMRLLVEALRELAGAGMDDLRSADTSTERVALDALLQETVADLRPVADARGVGVWLESGAPLPVAGSRRKLAPVVFKLLESALALAARGSILQIAARKREHEAEVAVRWNPLAGRPEHSPFSRPELGLLLAQTGWRRAGGEWLGERTDESQGVTARMPIDPTSEAAKTTGDVR